MPKSKIIKELVNDEISLEKALHRVIVLAKDLKDFKLEQWAKNEINGYNNREVIPEYRRVRYEYYGDYILDRVTYKNSPLPMAFLNHSSPQKQWEFTTYKMNESISIIKMGKDEDKYELGLAVSPENLKLFSVDVKARILSGRGRIDKTNLMRILSIVKTKTLDILYELENKFGCLDDMDVSNGSDKVKEEARQKINQIIICDTYNNMEIGDGNTIKKSNFLSKLFKK